MSQVKFRGSGVRPSLEHASEAVPRAARAPVPTALSVLRNHGGERPVLRWRHWIVAVEPIGRVTLPVEARAVLHADGAADGLGGDAAGDVRALCRDLALVLRGDGAGASLTVDGRGRLFLPAWLRQATVSSGSVLVAFRCVEQPMVVLRATGVLDALVDGVAGEGR